MKLTYPILFLFSLFTTCVQAQDEARVILYLFDNGVPVSGAHVRLNDSAQGDTNKHGAVRLQAGAGDYAAQILLPDQSQFQQNLSVTDAEFVVLILSHTAGEADWLLEQEGTAASSVSADRSVSKTKDSDQPLLQISGVVSAHEGGFAIPGARVYISGLRGSLLTDAQGRFSVMVPAGIYSLSVMHPDYSTQTVKNQDVILNEGYHHEFRLTPQGIELQELVVAAPTLEGGFAALADEQRNSANVTEVIGAKQISQAGDSDAAGALKRVTGLTLVDGKYIYVRGLGERYSSTTLNGAGLPSPDPTRKVVPLDLFPTGILESVVIQKTYSPDMPGDFGGGSVLLRTRGTPEEKVRKLSLSIGGNDISTGKRGDTYQGGDMDWLGIDDGTRAMPQTLESLTDGGRKLLVLQNNATKEAAGESLANNYATHSKVLPADVGIKANFANRNEQYNANWGWGYNLALNYHNQWRRHSQHRVTYGLGGIDGGLVAYDDVEQTDTENEIDVGAMLNLSLEIGNNNEIEAMTLLTRKTTDTVYRDEGYLSENDLTVHDTTLEWVERQLFTQQLSGRHILPSLNDLAVDWVGAFATARRYEPDTRFYRYELQDDGRYAFSQEGQSNERSFEDLHDYTYSGAINFTLPLYTLLGSEAAIKSGVSVESKRRQSNYARFRFQTDWSTNDIDPDELYSDSPEDILVPDNIDNQGYVLRNTTLPTDNYNAQQVISAAYLMADGAIGDSVKVMAGARTEQGVQVVETYQLTSPDESHVSRLERSDLLPAVSATWLASRKHQFRFAYSQTINRPDFKELSEAPYIDPETRDVVIGNPKLDRARITHYDLRWEWYLTRFETSSVAVFYKEFEQPIERVIRLGAGGVHSFANAVAARNYGVEVQSRFWLSRLLGDHLRRFYLESNLAMIDSEVELGQAGAQQTHQTRPLQGQSPWIANFTLAYENLVTRTHASLLFNKIGARITSVGTSGLPDAYEQPAARLDFVCKQELYEGTLDHLNLQFKAKNILAPDIIITRGDEVEKSKQSGRSYSLTLEYSWK